MTVLNACIAGDLHTAEELLVQEIEADDKDYDSYANRSIIMARGCEWDHALRDAVKVRRSPPINTMSMTG